MGPLHQILNLPEHIRIVLKVMELKTWKVLEKKVSKSYKSELKNENI
jgi:hypothetical protein